MTEDSKLLNKLRDRVTAAEKIYDSFFEKMDEWEQLAKYGSLYANRHKYTANITDQVIQQLVSSLYAQNPKIKAFSRERIDYTVWNGEATQLAQAIAVVSMAPELAASGIDPQTPKILEADAIVQDALAVHKFKDFLDRKGKTLELLFLYFIDEQSEDFFGNFQRMIRRALINGVGWIKLGFQRETGFDNVTERKISDHRTQIKRLESLDGEDEDEDDRQADLEEQKNLLAGLQDREIVIREGLVFDFPLSRNVIIDPKATSWSDLSSADWICEIHLMTKDEIGENFPDFDLDNLDRSPSGGNTKVQPIDNDSGENTGSSRGMSEEDFSRVYEYYDKKAGLVYWFIDGYEEYLIEPGAPNVEVEGFYPYENLIFNGNENIDDTTPMSDVDKMRDPQEALNQKRQWSLDHVRHALPKYLSLGQNIDDALRDTLANSDEVGLVIPLKSVTEGQKLSDVFQKMETTGLDPNLYATHEQTQDITTSTNASQAQLGASASGTATAASIAQASFSNVIDVKKTAVDTVLSRVAKKASQILQIEMSADMVKELVGRGAIWEESTRADIYKEVMLDIEAGSSGLPNQAEQLLKAEKILPLLVQNENVDQLWTAQIMVKLLDSKVDLSEAILESPAFAVQQAQTEALAGGTNQVTGGANAPVLQGGSPRKPKPTHTTGGGFLPSPTNI